jgi:hypothetical protein
MPKKRTPKGPPKKARGGKAAAASKARRAGVSPTQGKRAASPAEIRNQAESDFEVGQRQPLEVPRLRVQSHVTPKAVQREGKDRVSREGLSRQARQATQKRKREK